MSALIPKDWMPACKMERVIIHWTAGGYHASDTDKEHYHILVEGPPTNYALVRGDHSIEANLSTADGSYAAHVKNMNTGSIGITACCMAEAEQGGDSGPYPLTEAQWAKLAQATAELILAYDIPLTRTTVMQHGEVEKNYGVAQDGKWDITVLPWAPELPATDVCEAFRDQVLFFVNNVPNSEPQEATSDDSDQDLPEPVPV